MGGWEDGRMEGFGFALQFQLRISRRVVVMLMLPRPANAGSLAWPGLPNLMGNGLWQALWLWNLSSVTLSIYLAKIELWALG